MVGGSFVALTVVVGAVDGGVDGGVDADEEDVGVASASTVLSCVRVVVIARSTTCRPDTHVTCGDPSSWDTVPPGDVVVTVAEVGFGVAEELIALLTVSAPGSTAGADDTGARFSHWYCVGVAPVWCGPITPASEAKPVATNTPETVSAIPARLPTEGSRGGAVPAPESVMVNLSVHGHLTSCGG